MKKWKCTVCGYILKGDEPPDKCPVCGADKSLFVLLEEKVEQKPTGAFSPIADVSAEPSRKWRCTVCGYIHSGSEPPVQCPVCRAERLKFVPFDEGAAQTQDAQAAKETKQATRKNKVDTQQDAPRSGLDRLALSHYGQKLTQWHGHPIAVHIPNGVLPMSFIFVLLASFFKSATLATVAQYNMGFVALSMPIVIGTGLIDWVNGFKGKMTQVFRTKMICAGIVTLLSLTLVVWGIVRPGIYTGALSENWLFLILHIANLAAAIVAGWQGGKLVFRK